MPAPSEARRTPIGTACLAVAALLVVGSGCRLAGASPNGEQDPIEPANQVVDVDLEPDGSGWVLDASHNVFMTPDGGDTWLSITPPIDAQTVSASGDNVLVASIVELVEGDVIKGFEVAIAASSDKGETWNSAQVPINGQPGSVTAELEGRVAALLVQQTTSSNFSVADVLVSDDFQKWTIRKAPVAGEIAILPGDVLWIAGGASGGELFRSSDYGSSWLPAQLPVRTDAQFGVDLPASTGKSQLPVVATINGDTSDLLIYDSADSGASWQEIHKLDVPFSTGPGVAIPATLVEGAWRIVTPDRTAIAVVGDTVSSSETRGLSGTVTSLSMSAHGLGWALVTTSDCPSKEECESLNILMRSLDGGTTWDPVGDIAPN
jgi:hypothetical protein